MKSNSIASAVGPSICFLADPAGLSVSIIEIFLSKFCEVKIISNKTSEWKKSLIHLSESSRLKIISASSGRDLSCDFVVSISHFDRVKNYLDNEKRRINLSVEISSKNKTPTIFLAPLVATTDAEVYVQTLVKEAFEIHKDFIGVIYFGDLLGPRTLYRENSSLDRLIHKRFPDEGGVINNFYIYPTSTARFSREVVKSLFSFGAVGSEKAFVSEKTNAKDFSQKYLKMRLNVSNEISKQPKTTVSMVAEMGGISRNLINETLKWQRLNFSERASEPKMAIQRPAFKKSVARKIKLPRLKFDFLQVQPDIYKNIKKSLKEFKLSTPYKLALSFFGLFLVTPYLLLGVSITSLSLYTKNLKGLKIENAQRALSFSEKINKIYLNEIDFFQQIPILSSIVEPIKNTGQINKRVVVVGNRFDEIFEATSLLVGFLFDDTKQPLGDTKKKMSLSLEEIYGELGFIEGEVSSSSPFVKSLYSFLFREEELRDLRQTVLLYDDIVSQLEYLLGFDGERNILVVFQDENVLRPTGGAITDVAFIKIRNGNMFVSDVFNYSALDKQIRGQIEPPKILKKYLGSDTWSTRDANWFSDFPKAAEKIEWFIDKEIGESFDGVLALTHGSYFSLAFNFSGAESSLDADSLYNTFERIRGVVAENKREENINMLSTVGKLFDQKEILLFLHNDKLKKSLSSLGWDGAINRLGCSENCYSDFLSVVESDFGDSGVSKQIKRDASLNIFLQEGLVSRTLSLRITNTSDKSEYPTTYSSYTKVVVPADSVFQKTQISKGESSNVFIEPDIEVSEGKIEAGVFYEVLPGQTKTLHFQWESGVNIELTRQGEYGLVVRRQPGVEPYDFQVLQDFGENVSPAFSLGYFLTQNGTYRYNTHLARDFSSRTFW